MQLNRQQPAPAASLKAVLKERKLRADEGTKSNDYTKGIKMCQELQRPVVLVDRRIILHWPGDGLSQPSTAELPGLAGQFAAASGRAD
jgi:hypothetical protein